MKRRDFFARQLSFFLIDNNEVELVSRGLQLTQIWVHYRGRIFANNVNPKWIEDWRTQACWFFFYIQGAMDAGIEPAIVDDI